ncbi:MAG: CPBP family intramembrane metalloprotease [Prevotella sp.]|nr:CPBP family intramembrane metalloprotease [Prevotella sp.]
MKKAIIYVLTFAAIQVLVPFLIQQSLQLFTGTQPTMDANMMILSITASSVAIMALFFYFGWTKVSRSYVRSQPWGVLFWCALAAVGTIIPSTCFQEMLPELPNLAEEQFDMILRSRWGYFAVGLLAPVCEELVFRGAVLRSLLGWAKHHWTAIAVSALFFALVHANPAQMPHAFLVGLLLGWLYYRTDSVVPGVAFHWVNNSIAYFVYNLYPDPSIKLVDIFGSQRTVAAAVLFSLFILLPALYQLNQRLRKA